MMRIAALAALIALVVLPQAPASSEPVSHGPFAPVGGDVAVSAATPIHCVPLEMYETLRKAHDAAQSERPGSDMTPALLPQYIWPIERPLNDELVLINYVDDDDTTTGLADYMGLPHAYDGHRGTDLGLLSFRAMDHGYRVLAGSSGTVVSVAYSNPDRSTGPPFGPANYVVVDNGDGSSTFYYHFRRNAVTVELGEAVQGGQVLGLAGSSGFSYDPHLHFEVFDPPSPNSLRDPWNGPNNPDPSLWISQEPYVGDDTLHLFDMGISTEAAAGGDVTGIPSGLFKERLSQPVVMGANEPYIVAWFQAQTAGLTYRVQIRRPDNSLFAGQLAGLPKILTGWIYHYWNFSGSVSPADYGVWTMQFRIGTTIIKSVPFTVDATTRFGPRFAPIAGRSFRIDGIVQRDTLRVSALGGAVTYSLLGAPDFVSLVDDSIVTVAGVSSQTHRSTYFQAIATDGFAVRDTMWYHVVDPTKPIESGVGVTPPLASVAPTSVRLSSSEPNPFAGVTVVRYAVPRREHATLRVFDAGGRLVATLFDGIGGPAADGRVASWDGRTSSGLSAPSGVYFFRLEAGGERETRKAVLLR